MSTPIRITPPQLVTLFADSAGKLQSSNPDLAQAFARLAVLARYVDAQQRQIMTLHAQMQEMIAIVTKLSETISPLIAPAPAAASVPASAVPNENAAPPQDGTGEPNTSADNEDAAVEQLIARAQSEAEADLADTTRPAKAEVAVLPRRRKQ